MGRGGWAPGGGFRGGGHTGVIRGGWRQGGVIRGGSGFGFGGGVRVGPGFIAGGWGPRFGSWRGWSRPAIYTPVYTYGYSSWGISPAYASPWAYSPYDYTFATPYTTPYVYGAAPSPVTIVTVPAVQSSPGTIVVTDDTPGLRLREYLGPRPQDNRTDSSPIYLIAEKDGVIRAALAYWVEGATLRWITLQKQQSQMPIDRVDRALTEQLNRERGVDFRLPAPR